MVADSERGPAGGTEGDGMETPDDTERAYAERAREILGVSRWWQVVAAAAMMAAVSPYQYVWSSIQQPLGERLDVALPALALVFSLYVVFQSLSQFPAGWWRDRRGPKAVTYLAAVLAGGSYIALAYATSLWQLYILYSLGAIGVGIIYTVAVNTAIKWFPDRRGLTTGIGTMAFAAGSALLVPYVRANATVAGYPRVLRNVGLLIFGVLLVGAVVLRDPPGRWLARAEADAAVTDGGHAGARAFTWRGMVRTWQFWLLYGMFVAVSGADLLLIAQIVGFAEQVGFAAAIATISATVIPLASGVSRIVIGEISDRFRREHVMAASFVLAGVFRLLMVYTGLAGGEVVFVVLVILAMFFSSPLYVLFPSLLSDYYGVRYSSGNYALLYTAKIGGGIFGGSVAGALIVATGWSTTFVIGGAIAAVAGLAALALRPPRRRSTPV